MWRETDFLGILFTPATVYVLVAGMIYLPARLLLVRTGAARAIWHFPLAGAALYVIILGALLTYF